MPRPRFRNAVEDVLAAWTVAGPVPEYHRAEQQRLREKWPALAVALESLAEAAADPRAELAAWEYGWAADARSQHWYATREEAQEYTGDPQQFRRRPAGEWEPVP